MIKILFLIISINLSYYNQDIERSQYGVWCECVQQEILFCETIVQQSTTETQNGNTGVGKSHNNLFGFRSSENYMYFKTLRSSISYYKSWQNKYYPSYIQNHPNSSYYSFLEYIGWKTGKSNNPKERKYTNYLQRIKLNF